MGEVQGLYWSNKIIIYTCVYVLLFHSFKIFILTLSSFPWNISFLQYYVILFTTDDQKSGDLNEGKCF